jgi:uncharacterized MnhB-related membrane protein
MFATIGAVKMMASAPTQKTAVAAAQNISHPMQTMPSRMRSACFFADRAQTELLIGTGVVTSVFLFAVVHFVVPFLLVNLVVLISILLLTCLTRSIRLEHLVGQSVTSATSSTQGD